MPPERCGVVRKAWSCVRWLLSWARTIVSVFLVLGLCFRVVGFISKAWLAVVVIQDSECGDLLELLRGGEFYEASGILSHCSSALQQAIGLLHRAVRELAPHFLF